MLATPFLASNCLTPGCRAETVMATKPLYYTIQFGIAPTIRALVYCSRPTYNSVKLQLPRRSSRSTVIQVAVFYGMREVAEMFVGSRRRLLEQEDNRATGKPAYYWARFYDWTDMAAYMGQQRPEIDSSRLVNRHEPQCTEHATGSRNAEQSFDCTEC